ncbi:MAG TPA: pilin [Candidatus Saccharimonadales bacterium]|jgi:hypothetical protein|nr:pilin [Candidatus Saccharimonadales bacterium]
MIDILRVVADLSPVCAGGSCGLPTAQADQSAIDNILQIVFGIVGALSLLMITVSGLRYILSDGSPEKTAKARGGLIYALVGLTIALTAEAIVTFVLKRL